MITMASVAHDYGIDLNELLKLNPGHIASEPFNSINDIKMPESWYREHGYNMTDQLVRSEQPAPQPKPQPARTQNQKSGGSRSWLSQAWNSVTSTVGEFFSDVADTFRTETNPYTGKKEGFFSRLGKEFSNVMGDWKKREDQIYNNH